MYPCDMNIFFNFKKNRIGYPGYRDMYICIAGLGTRVAGAAAGAGELEVR
jgi:hypothetical protein